MFACCQDSRRQLVDSFYLIAFCLSKQYRESSIHEWFLHRVQSTTAIPSLACLPSILRIFQRRWLVWRSISFRRTWRDRISATRSNIQDGGQKIEQRYDGHRERAPGWDVRGCWLSWLAGMSPSSFLQLLRNYLDIWRSRVAIFALHLK